MRFLQQFFALTALAALLLLALTAPLRAQSTQPVWWPGYSLYGKPIAQPYFDFPSWAHFTKCRPPPLAWGYDPFPGYGPGDCEADGYKTLSCIDGLCAHRPSDWYTSTEFSPLTLDHLDGFAVARIGPTALAPIGAVVLTTEDIRQEFAPAGKYTIGKRIFDCYRLDFTYFGVYTWNDARAVTNTDVNSLAGVGNLSTFLSGFSDPITAGVDGASLVSIALKSQFQSGELNLRYWGDLPPGPFDASFIVGGRYMRLAEQFNFSSIADQPAPGGTAIDIQSNTTNDLWGVQVGLEGAWLVSQRWWFDFVMKGGIFNDHITATNNVVNNGVPTLITDTRDRTAWVGDLALTANWQMTPWLTFRAGYQALFFNGLGLAQEQVSSALLTNTPGPLNDSGKIAIHGPTIGLMAYW